MPEYLTNCNSTYLARVSHSLLEVAKEPCLCYGCRIRLQLAKLSATIMRNQLSLFVEKSAVSTMKEAILAVIISRPSCWAYPLMGGAEFHLSLYVSLTLRLIY